VLGSNVVAAVSPPAIVVARRKWLRDVENMLRRVERL